MKVRVVWLRLVVTVVGCRFKCGACAGVVVFVPFLELDAEKVGTFVVGWGAAEVLGGSKRVFKRLPVVASFASTSIVRLHHETPI